MSHTPPRPWAAGAESVGAKTCPRLSSGQQQGFCRWLVLFWAPCLFQLVVGEYLDGIPSGEKKKKKQASWPPLGDWDSLSSFSYKNQHRDYGNEVPW